MVSWTRFTLKIDGINQENLGFLAATIVIVAAFILVSIFYIVCRRENARRDALGAIAQVE